MSKECASLRWRLSAISYGALRTAVWARTCCSRRRVCDASCPQRLSHALRNDQNYDDICDDIGGIYNSCDDYNYYSDPADDR